MPEVRHDEPGVRDTAPGAQDDEPAWVQRMREAGYNIRRGTVPGRLSEIPEAMFTPPPARERVRGYLSLIARWFRRARPDSLKPRGGHAPLP
jgi:hypothetical protein